MNTSRTYFQLGDGFEFILPMLLPIRGCAVLPFMTHAIYSFDDNNWLKYATTVTDADCVVYQYRTEDMASRRSNFDDLPVLTLQQLCELGYLKQLEGTSAFLMNKTEYGQKRRAFVEKIKTLPTTINLGVDEEMKSFMERQVAEERKD